MSKERPSSVSVLKTIIFVIIFIIIFLLLLVRRSSFDNFQFEKKYSPHTFFESVFPV